MVLKQVNKKLGENVNYNMNLQVYNMGDIIRKHGVLSRFMSSRSAFNNKLKENGYTTEMNGNYIVATKHNEVVRFYFTSHSVRNKNYLIPVNLEFEVDYFAFYCEATNRVYIVGYGMVRKYCKGLKTSYTFFDNRGKEKLFIPDRWAEQQQINTIQI